MPSSSHMFLKYSWSLWTYWAVFFYWLFNHQELFYKFWKEKKRSNCGKKTNKWNSIRISHYSVYASLFLIDTFRKNVFYYKMLLARRQWSRWALFRVSGLLFWWSLPCWQLPDKRNKQWMVANYNQSLNNPPKLPFFNYAVHPVPHPVCFKPRCRTFGIM